MSFKFEDFVNCLVSGLSYLPNTLILTVTSVLVALVFGFILAVLRFYRVPVVSQVLAVLVPLVQGIPLMVMIVVVNLVFIYTFNDVAAALGLDLTVGSVNKIYLGIVVMSLFETTVMTETLRGVLNSIDKTQFEAGHSVGMTTVQTLRRIIVPQVFVKSVPALTNLVCGTVKGTALIYSLGVMEVFNGSILPCGQTYHYLEGYVAAALIFWAVSLIIELAGHFIETTNTRVVRG